MIYSPSDITLVLGIALLVFGPKRLPELGRAIGQGLGNFKRSLSEAENAGPAQGATAETLPLSRAELESKRGQDS